MRLSFVPIRTLNAVPLGQHAADKLLSLFIDPLKNKDVVLSIAKKMEEEFKNVIKGHKSVLKKTHTFIQDFPDGKEKGEFLGLHFDHGIINMAGIKVDGLMILDSFYETVIVPEEERLLRGTERVLFVAQSLKRFANRIRTVILPDIGPVWNVGINHGYLEVEGRFGLTSLHSLSWPDEYNFTGKPVRMRSFAKEILKAADSIGLNLCVKGFLHTPEAVFLDSILKYPGTAGALSLDHRCSTCIKTETQGVKKLSYKDDDKPYILIKIFWETFGEGGEMKDILNDFDKQLDEVSSKPGSNFFEKIVSEEYIIKTVRMVLLALAEEGHLFKSNPENKTRLKEYLQESTHHISSISRSYSRGMWDQLMRTFRFPSLEVKESFIISRVVEVVSWRASLILAILISVCHMNNSWKGEDSVFLINGSHSVNEIRDILSALNLVQQSYGVSKKRFSVKFSTNSQVSGAAVLAAIYTKDPFDYDADYVDD